MSNAQQVQQEITRAENKLKQLQRDQPSLEALAAKNQTTLSNLEQSDSSDFEAILEARMRANAAEQMLKEHQDSINTSHADLERLTTELEAARKADALAAAEAEHEQVMTAWYKQAAQSVRAFKAELDKLTKHSQRAGVTAKAAKEAAEANGVNYSALHAPPEPATQLDWLKVDDVDRLGGDYPLPSIRTDYMQLSPPTIRRE